MNELALFAGAGGGILGGKLLGWRTVCAVEIEPYRIARLMQRQNEGFLEPFPIWDDVRTFNGKPWRGIVDVVSGGFPCQDISAAGTGAGIEGERSGLWREMARIISEVRPLYVFVENSPLLVGRGLAVVLGDLAQMGYDARWGIVGAHHSGAYHKRDRIWLLAYPAGQRRKAWGPEPAGQFREVGTASSGRDMGHSVPCRCKRINRGARAEVYAPTFQCGRPRLSRMQRAAERPARGRSTRRPSMGQGVKPEIPDAEKKRLENGRQARGEKSASKTRGEVAQPRPQRCSRTGWPAEPGLGRVAYGVADRVDRISAIGDGQVPRVVAMAWRILTETA